MSESTPPNTILSAFDAAQRETIALTRAVVARLEVGMSPQDIAALATDMASQHGFTSWFHRPEVTFDPRPAARRVPFSPHGGSSTDRLTPGTLIQLDLAPATGEAFGDFGTVVAFQHRGPLPRAVTEARELCLALCSLAGHQKCVGELFVFAQSWTNNRRLSMGSARAVGHACLPPEGLAAAAWPRVSRAATFLRRNQIQWFNPRLMAGAYAVNPPVICDGHVLAFEELIFVDGPDKRVLGRDSLQEIGTL